MSTLFFYKNLLTGEPSPIIQKEALKLNKVQLNVLLAKLPNLDERVNLELSKSRSGEVISAWSQNPNVTPSQVNDLVKEATARSVLNGLADAKVLTLESFQKIVSKANYTTVFKLLQNETFPESLVNDLINTIVKVTDMTNFDKFFEVWEKFNFKDKLLLHPDFQNSVFRRIPTRKINYFSSAPLLTFFENQLSEALKSMERYVQNKQDFTWNDVKDFGRVLDNAATWLVKDINSSSSLKAYLNANPSTEQPLNSLQAFIKANSKEIKELTKEIALSFYYPDCNNFINLVARADKKPSSTLTELFNECKTEKELLEAVLKNYEKKASSGYKKVSAEIILNPLFTVESLKSVSKDVFSFKDPMNEEKIFEALKLDAFKAASFIYFLDSKGTAEASYLITETEEDFEVYKHYLKMLSDDYLELEKVSPAGLARILKYVLMKEIFTPEIISLLPTDVIKVELKEYNTKSTLFQELLEEIMNFLNTSMTNKKDAYWENFLVLSAEHSGTFEDLVFLSKAL